MSESSSIGDPPCDSVVIVLSKSGQAHSLAEKDLIRIDRLSVIPAHAGTQGRATDRWLWVPASAGTTITYGYIELHFESDSQASAARTAASRSREPRTFG